VVNTDISSPRSFLVHFSGGELINFPGSDTEARIIDVPRTGKRFAKDVLTKLEGIVILFFGFLAGVSAAVVFNRFLPELELGISCMVHRLNQIKNDIAGKKKLSVHSNNADRDTMIR
jgi:hypothetical protein